MSEQEIEVLQNEREGLVKEKQELAASLASLGISGNRAYYARGTIDKDTWALRTTWANRINAVEKRLLEIKAVLKLHNILKESEWTLAKALIRETFGDVFTNRFLQELGRRCKGEPPTKVTYELKGAPMKNYKKELIEMYDFIISIRETITEYISANQPEVNQADFLKSVRSINTAVPPVIELQKRKRAIK